MSKKPRDGRIFALTRLNYHPARIALHIHTVKNLGTTRTRHKLILILSVSPSGPSLHLPRLPPPILDNGMALSAFLFQRE